ncbi:hypothetical protein EON67_05085 [archaeon]|nr:MAG: hypothetical protein EON67_05085 [archaeon]
MQVVRLSKDSTILASTGYTFPNVIAVKDLGPQIGYRTVFVVEYLGPILIMLAYGLRPAALYGESAALKAWNPIAVAAFGAWIAHFVKRELVCAAPAPVPRLPLCALFTSHYPALMRRGSLHTCITSRTCRRRSLCTSSHAPPCPSKTCSRTPCTTGVLR